MAGQSRTLLPARSEPTGPNRGWWYSIATLAAMMVGLAIATQQWFVLGAIGGLLLVLVWPVEVTLGGFALLIPFESIAVLGHGSGSPAGTTLNW